GRVGSPLSDDLTILRSLTPARGSATCFVFTDFPVRLRFSAVVGPNLLDDLVLNRRLEIGMHRQADQLAGLCLRHWQPPRTGRIDRVYFLFVNRNRIIDSSRHVLSLQMGSQAVPLAYLDCILRPS